MPPRIFIGGTGRSGTTILYKALGCHEAIHALGEEMRFLVDPDGLINLVDALTVRYSPVHGQEALFRFERLMRQDLVTPMRPPFLSSDIAQGVGKEYYWQRLDKFCSQLFEIEYSVPLSKQPKPIRGNSFPARARRKFKRLFQNVLHESDVPYRITYNWPRSNMKVARFFPDRAELVTSAAAFVDDLFLYPTYKDNKKTWCEKTPQNIFHIDFLWELFPDSVFLHIKRDPRGVVQSVLNQSWGPNNVHDVCSFLIYMYERWFSIEKDLDLGKHRYMEVPLENLAADPNGWLERIAAFCYLDNCYSNLPEIIPEKVNYWQKSLTVEEKRTVNDLLGPYIERFGYKI